MLSAPGRLKSRFYKKGGPFPSGLVLQLDATNAASLTKVSNVVNGWNDLSGVGNHFATGHNTTSYNPTYSATGFLSGPAVYFDGGQGTYLELIASTMAGGIKTNNYTTIVVLRTNYHSYGIFIQDPSSENIFKADRGNRLCNPGRSVQGFPYNAATIMGVASNGTAVPSYLLNGKVVHGFSPYGNGWTNNVTMAKLMIGDSQPAGGVAGGYWRACYMWNRKLSDAELLSTYSYLATLHGVTPITKQANIIFDGDSITYGYYGDTQPFPSLATGQVTALSGLTECDYVNFGIGGQTTATMTSNFTANITPLYDGVTYLPKYNVVVMQEITNELNGGTSAAQCITNLKAYGTQCLAAGFKLVFCTCLPRTTITGQEETDRGTVNTWLTGTAVSGGWATAIADIASATNMSDPTNTTYYADGTHPTQAGHTAIAPCVAAAISTAMT